MIQYVGLSTLTSGKQDDDLFEQVRRLLDDVGFSRSYNRQNIPSELRSLYQRAHPSQQEISRLGGLLHKIYERMKP